MESGYVATDSEKYQIGLSRVVAHSSLPLTGGIWITRLPVSARKKEKKKKKKSNLGGLEKEEVEEVTYLIFRICRLCVIG